MDNDKPGDPAEKGVDQFVNRRAGYGDKYNRIYKAAKNGGTLYAGEGAQLVQKIEALEDELRALRIPNQQFLRKLVDIAWSEATASEQVPSTSWADEIINRAYLSKAPVRKEFCAEDRALQFDPYDPKNQPGLWGKDGTFRIKPDGGVERLSDEEAAIINKFRYSQQSYAFMHSEK